MKVKALSLIGTKYEESGLPLQPLIGAIVTGAIVKLESVTLTFDTGDVLVIAEEGQAGEISFDLMNWMPPKL